MYVPAACLPRRHSRRRWWLASFGGTAADRCHWRARARAGVSGSWLLGLAGSRQALRYPCAIRSPTAKVQFVRTILHRIGTARQISGGATVHSSPQSASRACSCLRAITQAWPRRGASQYLFTHAGLLLRACPRLPFSTFCPPSLLSCAALRRAVPCCAAASAAAALIACCFSTLHALAPLRAHQHRGL